MKPAMIACLAAALVLAACGTPVSTLSGRQVESLSPGEVRTRAMEQLTGNLVPYAPIDRYSRGKPAQPEPLYDTTFATRPYGFYQGWCRFDAIELRMSPIAAEERTADTRVVATGVTVRPAFLQLKPELSARESTPADEAALHAECGRLDLQDNRFVHAPNFELASAAQKAYRELIAGIRSDAPPFEVRCGGPAGASSCKETVEQDRTIEFMVGSCGQYDPHPTCISIRTFDHDIEVTLSKGVIQKVIFENRVFVISGN